MIDCWKKVRIKYLLNNWSIVMYKYTTVINILILKEMSYCVWFNFDLKFIVCFIIQLIYNDDVPTVESFEKFKAAN